METLLIWKIVLPVVVIVGSIAIYYGAKNIMKEKNNNTYIYPKTGHKYMPLYRCKLKCPINGEWFDALIYQGLDDGGKLYVRERKDFLDKFVKFLDWKDGTGRTEKRKG